MQKAILISLAAAVVWAWGGREVLFAQQFRIESQTYLSDQGQSASENLTLFDNQVIYDFSLAPDGTREPIEIAAYDSSRRRFVLMDIRRQVRVEIEQFQVVQMLEQLRAQLADDPDSQWLVDPGFQETVDLDAGSLTLDGPIMHYQATCEPHRDAAVQARILEFLDQFTMLGATDPRRLPPFPRMQFNQAMKKYPFFATEIELTIDSNPLTEKGMKARTRHTLIPQLSAADRERIEQARQSWTSFPLVSLEAYRQLDETAENDGAPRKNRKSRQ